MISGRQGRAYKLVLKHLRNLKLQRKSPTSPDESEFYLRNVDSKAQMITEIDKWAVNVQTAAKVSDEVSARWQCHISEVVTNAFQHSGGGKHPAVLLNGRVSDDQVQLAVLDHGDTIPKTIAPRATQHKLTFNESELIEFACRRSISAKTVKENQGYGLSDLVDVVRENHGRLIIFSGNGLLYLNKQGRVYTRKANWLGVNPRLNGTLILVNLSTTREQ